VRIPAAKSLGELGSKKAIAPLIALLKDKDSEVRMLAADSLAQLGSEKAIAPLIALLKDKGSEVRSLAADLLAQLGSEKAIAPLIVIASLKELDSIKLLAQLGAKQAIEPLIALLKNTYEREQTTKLLKLLNNSEPLSKKSEKSNSEESKQNIQQLLDSLENDNINTQKQAIESLGKIATQVPKESQAKILEKLTAIASNQQELFGTRIKALENLGKLGTEAAANNIIQIAKQAQGEYRDSYIFTAYQALQDTKTPIALKFLQQALDKLTQQKQQWRNQRDNEKGNLVRQPSTTECKVSPQLDNEKRWQYGYWETELGYAIAQHDPANLGIEMLKHPLANVRPGAWFGIAKIGVPTIKILKKINKLRDKSTQPHFRHAAFRALDKSLITIEVYGTPEDVQALKTWRTEVTDFSVKDRIEFTLTELEYRLEQDSTAD
jgi:HEAT repeat protein